MDNGDVSGTTVTDKSGYGNNATSTGTTGVVGKIKQARNFDGTSDFIQAPDSANLSPTKVLTVSLWARQTSISFPKALTAKWTFQTDGSWGMQTDSSAGTGIQVFILSSAVDAGSNRGTSPAGSWTAGVWHHVSFVFNGGGTDNPSRLQIYIDGKQQSLTFTGTIPASLVDSASPVNVGLFGGSLARNWNGDLDDVRIYNRALSVSEVGQLYAAGKSLQIK